MIFQSKLYSQTFFSSHLIFKSLFCIYYKCLFIFNFTNNKLSPHLQKEMATISIKLSIWWSVLSILIYVLYANSIDSGVNTGRDKMGVQEPNVSIAFLLKLNFKRG